MHPRRLPFLRLLGASAGRVVLERAAATFLLLGVVAALVFGGQGMHPRTLTGMAIDHAPARLGLFAAWWLLTISAARPVFTTPSTFGFRALPVSRTRLFVGCLGLLLPLQVPWVGLWAVGAGWLWALTACTTSMALTVLGVARLRTASDAAVATALVASTAFGAPLPMLAAASGALVWGLPRAWTRGVEEEHRRRPLLVLGPAPVALGLAYGLCLWRAHRVLWLRAATVWLVWAVATQLTLHNNQTGLAESTAGVLLGAWLLALLVTSMLAGRLVWIAHEGRDVVALAGHPAQLRQIALDGTSAVLGAIVASSYVLALIGATLLDATPGDGLRVASLIAAATMGGAATGVFASRIARTSFERRGRGPGRALVATVAFIIGATSLSVVTSVPLIATLLATLAAGWLLRGRPQGSAFPEKGRDVLEVDAVRKQLGGRWVLDTLSTMVGPGEVLVVTGSNGAGKSTLLRVMAGLLQPDAGEVRLCGHAMDREGEAARRHLGYVSDALDAFVDLTVAEYLALLQSLRKAEAPTELMANLGVNRFVNQRFGTLSLGQRKRAAVCAASVGDPWLLIMDEPSNGLDPEAVGQMVSLVKRRRAEGRGAVVATNDPQFAAALRGRSLRLRGA